MIQKNNQFDGDCKGHTLQLAVTCKRQRNIALVFRIFEHQYVLNVHHNVLIFRCIIGWTLRNQLHYLHS
jgi:hypothetical protein